MASRIMMSCALLVQGNQENGAFFAPVWEESTGSADLQPRRLMGWFKANQNCHKRTEEECKNLVDDCRWDETDEDKSKHKCVDLTKEQKAEIAKKKAEEKKAAEEAKKAAEEAKKAAEEAKKAGEPTPDVEETESTQDVAVQSTPDVEETESTQDVAVPAESTQDVEETEQADDAQNQQADDAQNQDNAAGQAQTDEEKDKTDSAWALSAIFPFMLAMLMC